jgi:hypothetical protein
VTVWSKLSGCLLLLAGCRQPNPEWQGPAGGDAADTVTDPDTEPGNMSMPDGSKVDTEGQNCNNDNQCPDDWVCGPMGCQLGVEGDPCDGDGDCQDPTPICTVAGFCQDGNEGDPCDEPTDCAMPTGLCGPAMTCQSGEAGQACNNPNHCATGLTCTDGICG